MSTPLWGFLASLLPWLLMLLLLLEQWSCLTLRCYTAIALPRFSSLPFASHSALLDSHHWVCQRQRQRTTAAFSALSFLVLPKTAGEPCREQLDKRELPEGIYPALFCASSLCSFLGQSAEEERRGRDWAQDFRLCLQQHSSVSHLAPEAHKSNTHRVTGRREDRLTGTHTLNAQKTDKTPNRQTDRQVVTVSWRQWTAAVRVSLVGWDQGIYFMPVWQLPCCSVSYTPLHTFRRYVIPLSSTVSLHDTRTLCLHYSLKSFHSRLWLSSPTCVFIKLLSRPSPLLLCFSVICFFLHSALVIYSCHRKSIAFLIIVTSTPAVLLPLRRFSCLLKCIVAVTGDVYLKHRGHQGQ